MSTYFFGVAMVIFGFMGVIWTSSNWVNTFTKFVFLGMSGWAGWLLATALGYVVKV